MGYNLRGLLSFKKTVMSTTVKIRRIFSYGVTTWNELDDEFKHSNTVNQFKNNFLKQTIFNK